MSMSAELITSAFVMGLAGSLHCIGMCGPLALSLPVAAHSNSLSRISGGLIYNSGRILSYTMMGLLFGSAGGLIIATKWQSGLSIVLGTMILVYLFVPKRYFHFAGETALGKLFILVRRQLGRLFKSTKLSSCFFIGVLNGFLPCGLVYLALSSAVITASSLNGALFMLSFGSGTLPMMFSTVLMGNHLNHSFRRRIKSAVPVLLFVLAALLILRGMNLGIPFISPGFGEHEHVAVECH